MKRRKKMNELLKAMKNETNYDYTENGAITHKTTFNKVLDMFGMGGAMRNRDDEDVILMFKEAYEENPTLALRCLFYLRDIRGGQGERRFFRLCIKWLALNYPKEMESLIYLVPEYGRYDDLFELFGTGLENEMIGYIWFTIQQNKDHLVYKWMPSINASSRNTQSRGRKFAQAFGLTEKQYRKMLSEGRKACNLVETLMSQNEWDQIAFDKLPSRAGLLYKNAFMRREETKERYAEFMSAKDTKVNASTLNPVDIAHQIFRCWNRPGLTERLTWQKYWDALPNYYGDKEEPGIAIVDVSGSMSGVPMEAAVSMGAYIAERGKGPFKNHFITFSAEPQLVEFSGFDIYDKFQRAQRADWGMNTNIEAVFDMLLDIGKRNHVAPEEMPQTIYIFSDMEFDSAIICNSMSSGYGYRGMNHGQIDTLIEKQVDKWRRAGYKAPRIIFWNLRAAHPNIPAIGDGFSYVSGYSPVMIENILSGKDGIDLMLDKLNSVRYERIVSISNIPF
jgi:hypothetical protein